MMTVQVRFYTDPACPWSWAAEPALRRLMWEFEGELDFVWVMGGLARSYERANLLDVVSQWLEDGDAGGMPCDPRIWTQNPLDSTYPACQAVKAAVEQGWEAGSRYLRTLREGIMCERRKLDHADALIDAAGRAGIDRRRFEVDLRSHAITEAFGADLEEVRDPPQEAREADAIHRFGRCATRELELLAEKPLPVLEADLWALARDWKLKPVRILTGTLWETA